MCKFYNESQCRPNNNIKYYLFYFIGCHVHLGWKFISTKKNLVPRTFYGLSGKSLTVENQANHVEDDATETEDAGETTTEESN